MSDVPTTSKIKDPEGPVTVPRWVLDQLLPTCLGAVELFRALQATGQRPPYPTNVEIDDLDRAIEEAEEAEASASLECFTALQVHVSLSLGDRVTAPWRQKGST